MRHGLGVITYICINKAHCFPFRTLPSVKESHLVKAPRSALADFTAGMELHQSPNNVLYGLSYLVRPKKFEKIKTPTSK